MRWYKVLGIAAFAGVAATGAVIIRDQRRRRAYTPDEIRERLHARLAGTPATRRPRPTPARKTITRCGRVHADPAPAHWTPRRRMASRMRQDSRGRPAPPPAPAPAPLLAHSSASVSVVAGKMKSGRSAVRPRPLPHILSDLRKRLPAEPRAPSARCAQRLSSFLPHCGRLPSANPRRAVLRLPATGRRGPRSGHADPDRRRLEGALGRGPVRAPAWRAAAVVSR